MAITPVASFINHDLHTKLGILRGAMGRIEQFAETMTPGQQEILNSYTENINETLDSLSRAVMNFTDCLDLERFSDQGHFVEMDYQLERNKAQLELSGIELVYDQHFPIVNIHEDKFAFIMDAVLSIIAEFSPDKKIHLYCGDKNQLIFFIKESHETSTDIKNIKELLMGRSKVHNNPGWFNIYFSNNMLNSRGGGIFLQYKEPGIMAVVVDWGQ